MKKLAWISIAVVVAGFVGWQVYRQASATTGGNAGKRTNMAVPVEVEPVRRITLADTGFFTGTLIPRSRYVVAPKIAGRLEKLHVNMGDEVRRGQLVAILDDDEFRQQADQARAELEVARANLEESKSALDIASRERERAKALRAKKIASESELDEAEARYRAQTARQKVAQAQVTHKEASLKAAQIRLSYTQIHAAWEDGNGRRVVGERFVDEGAMLAPNAAIVSILDIGALSGVIHVIERDYSKLCIGQEAVVATDAFPGRTFSGKIVRVAPLLKETSRQARVEIEIPNPEVLLKPGMFVRVEIEFARYPDVTVVPRSSLVKRGGREGVFLVGPEGKESRFVPLVIGIVDGEWAQVKEPSLTGSVVVMGQHLLQDGSPILLHAASENKDTDRGPKAPDRQESGRPS